MTAFWRRSRPPAPSPVGAACPQPRIFERDPVRRVRVSEGADSPLFPQLRRPGALRVSPGRRQPGHTTFSDKPTAQESLERGLGGEATLSCWPVLCTCPPAGFSVSGEATRARSFEGLTACASIERFAARPALSGFWVLVALGHKSDSMFSRRRRRRAGAAEKRI